MTAWVALLRAVNVGGTGKIEMARLRKALETTELEQVRTYIASGNVVFAGPDDEAAVRRILADAITAEFGGAPDINMRTGEDMAEVLARNPFPDAPGNRVIVLFCDAPTEVGNLRHQQDEQVQASGREIFAFYPEGQGQSKLVIPAAKQGTGRNINTVAKLAEMAAAID